MTDYTRTFDLLAFHQDRFGNHDCLAGRDATAPPPRWNTYSIAQTRSKVDAMSHGLLALGVRPGERVCLVGPNTPDWLCLDLAIQQVGGITVPVYPTASDNDYAFILSETGARYCFAGNEKLFDRVASISVDLPDLERVFVLGSSVSPRGWDAYVDAVTQSDEELRSRRNGVTPDDTATIIFTSGTTGTPKGAMLTHRNIVSNVRAITATFPLTPGHRTLSFLPLSHSFERLVAYSFLASGTPIYLLDDLNEVRRALVEVRPHYFAAVPRLLEKQQEALVARSDSMRWPLRPLMRSALRYGRSYDERRPPGGVAALVIWLANQTVFARWRAALGGAVRLVLSGGAALEPGLIRLFNAARMTVIEGYGMTEASTFITTNRWEPEGRCVGTVGPPLPGIEVRIAGDGEVLIRGPNIMSGYFRRPDLTAEAIDEEGWLHSGDLGRLTPDGFLELRGRKKDLFKLSSGKYIAPEALENTFKRSPFIQQIVILGESRKYVAALIVPDRQAIARWCEVNGMPVASWPEATNDQRVIELFNKEVDRCNESLGHVEQVKRFALLTKEWTVEDGTLSATLKVKRPVILERYAAVIEGCYQ